LEPLEEEMKMNMRRGGISCGLLLVGLCAATPAHADLTHEYSFTNGATDSIGGANGTLMNSATVSGGALQLNNPNFTGNTSGQTDTSGYLSLPVSILPTSGAVTIETWFTFTGSGFFTEAWTFSNATDANPPVGGEYFMDTISAPQPAGTPGSGNNTGGNHIVEGLHGYNPGPEIDAFGTTPGMGAFGGGYLDNGDTCFSAVTIDSSGNLSYYLYDETAGVGGLQSVVAGDPLSDFAFTNAYLGRSAFSGDNATSGSIDEFRIYNNAETASVIAADYAAGPNVVLAVPEPVSFSVFAIGAAGLLLRRRNAAK
jgi:hypothetical protein